MTRVLKALNRIEGVVLILVLVFLIGLTLAGVVLRYVFNNPFTWMEEVQLASLVWITFLGASLAFRYHAHVGIEIVVDLLPATAQKVMRVVIGVVIFVVLAYLFLRCLDFLQVFIATGRTTSTLGIPFTVVYGVAPVSIVLMAISYASTEFWPALRDLRSGAAPTDAPADVPFTPETPEVTE